MVEHRRSHLSCCDCKASQFERPVLQRRCKIDVVGIVVVFVFIVVFFAVVVGVVVFDL